MDIPRIDNTDSELKVKNSLDTNANLETSVDEPNSPSSTDDNTVPAKKPSDEELSAAQSATIAELIESKKYNLAIKERHSKPFLVFSVGTEKKPLKKKPKAHPTSQVKVKKGNSRLGGQIFVLLALLATAYLVLDLGWIDIGWQPPFTIFGS